MLKKKRKKSGEGIFFFFVMRANTSFQRTAIAIVDYLRFENFAFQEFEILNAFQVK